jgi:hypothetical protein
MGYPMKNKFTPKITRYSQGKFSVESSDGNKEYVVRKVDEIWMCQCPDYFHRERDTCKHIHHILQALVYNEYEDRRNTKDLTSEAQSVVEGLQKRWGHSSYELCDGLADLNNKLKTIKDLLA